MNRARILADNKQWNRDNPEKHRQGVYRSRAKNPHKAAAVAEVGKAIKRGELIRPGSCQYCSRECKPEAHHMDYSKPLEVLWWCKSCHTRWHRSAA